MMRLLKLSLVATAGFSIAAIAAPRPERLRGIVSAVSANEVTVHTAAGDVSMSVGGDTKFLTTVHAGLKNITADSYIGVATKDVGGRHVALDIIIFPPEMAQTESGSASASLKPTGRSRSARHRSARWPASTPGSRIFAGTSPVTICRP
jgi:hypothetical protein